MWQTSLALFGLAVTALLAAAATEAQVQGYSAVWMWVVGYSFLVASFVLGLVAGFQARHRRSLRDSQIEFPDEWKARRLRDNNELVVTFHCRIFLGQDS